MKSIVNEFHEGNCATLYQYYGAHLTKKGTQFAVYAPNARFVSVVGDFNDWNGYEHPMKRKDDGTWELTVTDAKLNQKYKYRITDCHDFTTDKSDPFGFSSEHRPKTASVITNLSDFKWTDSKYLKNRTNSHTSPMNVYEVHLGAWMRKPNGETHSYEELIDHLIPYLMKHKYTHVEFMPLTEYPFDGSWGYQSTGYFCTTSRYGTPKQLKKLVNELHKFNIGVIFDLVLAHFVKDSHGLAYFDGTPLYEYPSKLDAISEWDTHNFDLWKEEVRSFLISAGNFWIEEFHFDGLRIDAVSNIIYWGGNSEKGPNEGALNFIKRFNHEIHSRNKGVMIIAEDSSSFGNVTKPSEFGGLGFDYKWDLGWMNDTLKYYGKDPVYRKHHHNDITFSMSYFYSEKFMLPLSHDEVVHGKGTIINKMWGTYEQKFAQCKNLFTYMYTHPGKKLSFMGNELAQFREFDELRECDFGVLSFPIHAAYNRFMIDLHSVYQYYPALWALDYSTNGFYWIDADNAQSSVYSYCRRDEKETLIIILNMMPTSYEHFMVGVPEKGNYIEVLNSDQDIYAGYNMCNYEELKTHDYHIHGFEQAIDVRIAPFASIILRKKNDKKTKKTKKDTNI